MSRFADLEEQRAVREAAETFLAVARRIAILRLGTVDARRAQAEAVSAAMHGILIAADEGDNRELMFGAVGFALGSLAGQDESLGESLVEALLDGIAAGGAVQAAVRQERRA